MKAWEFVKLFRSGYRLVAVLLGIVFLAFLAASSVADAQPAWPSKPIRVVVPLPVGGWVDGVVRIVTNSISPVLGQPIIVENRPGADTNIGTEVVARSPADGYTWLGLSTTFTTQISLRPKTLRYDPIKDFQPIGELGTSPNVFVVSTKLPVNTLEELIAYAKTRPAPLSYASPGKGTSPHLSMELFKSVKGIDMLHVVYKGQPEAVLDIIAGRVDSMIMGIPLALPQIKAGKLKPLAMIDTERYKQLPDVPTIVELGYPNLVWVPWVGLLMPAHTPKPIVQRVNAAVVKALQTPEVIEKLGTMGVNPAKPQRPEDFETMIKTEITRLAKIIREANVTVD